ncbi:hypothetical protein AGMMS49928_14370 [Spirochaetia bacterium]|nr:hypothetical protein AGMMS49928_14370 [Spirochaetia bacterium]
MGKSSYTLILSMKNFLSAAKIVLLGLAGALLNLGAVLLFQNLLGFPLFMDTLFTVALTFLGGLPCGIVTAILTHAIVNSLLVQDLPNYLYTLCNIISALVTAYSMRLFPAECSVNPGGKPPAGGIYGRITILFTLSLVMCILMSLAGGIISTVIETFFVRRDFYDAEVFIFKRMLTRKGLPLPLTEILCRIPVNILDRLISVFGGYGFARAVTFLITSRRERVDHGGQNRIHPWH